MNPVYAGHPAPPPSPDDAARARGSALRQARLVRARTLRKRLIAGALALFVATWVMITLVLISGHDPALAQRPASTVSVAKTSTTTATPATTTTAAATPTTTPATGSSSSTGSATGSVTTHQS
jgi:hypothetical protein